MLKSLVSILLIVLATGQLQAQTDRQGYAPWVNSFGNGFHQLRADSAQHVPHKYAQVLNTTDSTPQIFVWSTTAGDSLMLFVNGRYIVIGAGAFVTNIGGAVSYQSGTFASMPLAGVYGRFYATIDSARLYFDNGASWLNLSGGGGVLTFNNRSAAVTLTSADVLTALGYVPLSVLDSIATNPSAYVTQASRQKLVDSLMGLINARMNNYGGAPGWLVGTIAAIPAATTLPTGTHYTANDVGRIYVDTGSGGSRGWKLLSSGGTGLNQLTYDAIAGPGTGSVPIYLRYADSIKYRDVLSFFSTDSIYVGGHSIAYGLDASPQDSAWSYQLATYHGRPVVNHAVVGAGITGVVRQNNEYMGIGTQRASEFMGGLNTIRANPGATNAYQKIINGYAAIFVNQYSKNNYPATGSSPVTRTGSGWSSIPDTVDGSKSLNVAYTNNAGDFITYDFTDSSVAAVLMGCDSSGTVYNGSTVTVYMDGILQSTFSTSGQTDGVADPAGGYPGHRSPMAVIFKGLPYGAHTLKIVNTQSNYLYVDYFANLVDLHQAWPMLIMHDPYITTTAWAGTGNNGQIDVSNHKIDSLIAALQPYPVFDGITENYYTALTGTVSGDGIHPINAGYDLMTLAALAAADSGYTPGRLIYSGDSANGLYIKTATGIEKVLTDRNLGAANGVVINNHVAQLNPLIFTVVPGPLGNGDNGYTGINNTSPTDVLTISPQNTTVNAELIRLSGTSFSHPPLMGFDILTSEYGSVGLGNSIISDGAYNDMTMAAFGNVDLFAGTNVNYTAYANDHIFNGGAVELFRITNAGQYKFEKDTGALTSRFSYNSNLGSSFTLHSLVDKNYTDSAIAAHSGSGADGIMVPIGTNVTNATTIVMDSTSYARVGNTVFVDGAVTFTPVSGSANTQINMQTPIASTLASGHALHGVCFSNSSNVGGYVFSNTSTSIAALVVFPTGGTSNVTIYYHYSYRVQ